MRRRRSRRARPAGFVVASAVVLGLAGAVGAARPAGAQAETAAPFLLDPIAARAVGLGNAIVAADLGTESVSDNPAGLAWMRRREGAVHYGQDAFSNRFLAAYALPSPRFGTFAISGLLADYGSQEATFDEEVAVGSFILRDVYLAGSYASSLGKHLSVGVTYRFIQRRLDCSGRCVNPDDPTIALRPVASASAVDLGVQYDLGSRVPLTLGAAVRHLGTRLQVEDREQADKLPAQASVGARLGVPGIARSVPGATLRAYGEAVTGLGNELPGELRLGVEGVYRDALSLRAGYFARLGESGASGPSLGFGYAARRFALDFATQLSGLSVDLNKPPTFVALRYWF